MYEAWQLESNFIRATLQSFSTAIIASGIVGFVYFFYMKAEKRYEHVADLVDNWGLMDIYPNRKDEDLYRKYLQKSSSQIDIQAISLSRLYDDLGDEIEMAAKSGVQVRILLIDPDSEICNWIEQTHTTYEDLSSKIESSTRNYLQMDTENISVRYYHKLPVNYFRIDDRAFFGPYFTTSSRNTTTMFADANRGLATDYSNNFNDIWENHSESVQEDE